MTDTQTLQKTIDDLVQTGKGILAADESLPTITKRFKAIGVESTEETRRAWRELLLGTPGLGEYISGVILFEETLDQTDASGTPLPRLAEVQGIVPGIKVDRGKIPLPGAPGDMITQGLDFLAERLEGYREKGARFAKWREVYPISGHNPTPLGIEANAEVLARYASICQARGFVPIVEPEVLIDGDHSIERAFEVIQAVQHAVYHALHRHGVILEYTLLKPSMVTPGKQHPNRATPEEVAEYTVRALRRTVPAAVPSVNFLSGGQTPEEATANLNAMNALFPGQPWELSFSYARALQQPAMAAWGGRPENVEAARHALLKRARLNGAARRGEYRPDME
ncbi:MAG TPA: fructose-bisphosphate aldolase class I [Thiotrichales bacterium]|nr:fructose-bisphosphate aldolase class I [Thiotrichales bacterium]